MPAPRPPKLNPASGRPSPRELKNAGQQIGRSQRLTVSPPLTMQQGSSGFHLGVDTSGEPFLARLTGVYTPTSGAQNGINLYSFIEQSFDPATGIPKDANPGRQTYPAAPAQPANSYAIEENNTLLTVPGSTPTGYANPGPYVVMRLKGVIAGVPVYEFAGTPAVAWIKATSSAPVTVALAGGGSLAVFAAVADAFSAGWTDGVPVWFYEINGNAPVVGGRYQCRQLAKDVCGRPVWATEAIVTATTTTTTTTAGPGCTGTCRYTWSAASLTWSLQSNGCAATTTTTTTTGGPTTTTTCNPFVATTTSSTTTTAGPPCQCAPPTYCGTTNGECTQTNCLTGLLPAGANCTTTTTAAGTTTTSTTTTASACTTTISPQCTQCCFVWDGIAWIANGSFCSGVNCYCPGAPSAPGATCGTQQCFSCVQVVQSPPACVGKCAFVWIAPPGEWLLVSNTCAASGAPLCGPCVCPYPTVQGVCGHYTETACAFQCANTTTTACPCGPPYCVSGTTQAPACPGFCYWSWSGTAWTQLNNTCSAGCNCCPPGYNGTQTCETAQTSCNSPPICPTTTSTTTTTTTTTTTCGGTCTYYFDLNCNLRNIVNNCNSSSCGCRNFYACPPGGGAVQAPCIGTTTTAAPCGTCTYSPTLTGAGWLYLLVENNCTGTCGCCPSAGAAQGGGPSITVQCSAPACPTTTTAGAPGGCIWTGCGGNSWCIVSNNCAPGTQCAPPAGTPDTCCNSIEQTACTSTTTTPAPTCGQCVWTWNGPGAGWTQTNGACTGICLCQVPLGNGSYVGQTLTNNCQ